MIGRIYGKVVYTSDPLKKGSFVIVDVSGVGYKITVSKKFFAILKKDKEYGIFTYHQVSENESELYGFANDEEEIFFEILLSISGIGPKSAMNIFDKADVSIIKHAVILQKPDMLSSMSEISKKSAERIVLGLKQFAKSLDVSGARSEALDFDISVVEALESLGFTSEQARAALSEISGEKKSREQKIKEALKILGRKQ